MTSRRELRAIRRRAAILGVLAELGRVHPDGIGRALGRQPVRVINDLLALERDGRVVRDPGADVAASWWRLPTDAERAVPEGLRDADIDDDEMDDWVRKTLHAIFGDEP